MYTFSSLLTFAQQQMEALHIPGAAIGLQSGSEEYSCGLGVTSLDNPLPVTPQTTFRIGSITKLFTATAIFQLIEQGKISLDDHVRKYIPHFKVQDEEVSANVTVRHLLDHTSGWLGDYFINTGDGTDALAKFILRMAEVPQLTPLGKLFAYNNSAFNVAGRLIEIFTRIPFEIALYDMLLNPLGMKNSVFYAGDVILQRFALGHNGQGKDIKVAKPWVESHCDAPCGGLSCDVEDMLRFARFHMGDGTTGSGERLLKPTSLEIMQKPSIPAGESQSMGLNWFIEDVGGIRFFSHGGSSLGQYAHFWMAPEKSFAFVVLTNHDQGKTLVERLNHWVRLHFLHVEGVEPVPLELPFEQLTEYAGVYAIAGSGNCYEFRPEGGGFTMIHTPGSLPGMAGIPRRRMPPMRCALYARDQFIVTDGRMAGSKGEFIRDDDGHITWCRLEKRIFTRLAGDIFSLKKHRFQGQSGL